MFMQTGEGGVIGTILWMGMFFVFMFLYPRLMLAQLLGQLEKSAAKLETLSEKSKKLIANKIDKKPSKNLKEDIARFVEFFVVNPSDIDPFGMVRKLDQMFRNMEDRFDYFVNRIVKKNLEEKQKINYGLRASISVNMLAKLVRHNVELIKKLKNLQLALILQMQMPLIERIARSEYRGVESFVNGYPVGDSIGTLAASELIGDLKTKKIAKDVIMAKRKIGDVNCVILRADGPGPRLGRFDEALKKLNRRYKFSRIITIDAKGKLEGEKTGKVVEGVGFAMGGPNPQREMIEDFILKKKIPLDVIGINVGLEEAISPMPKAVLDSLPDIKKALNRSLERSKSPVLICGIGNSCGIPKGKKALEETKKLIKKVAKREEKRKKIEEKKPWYKF